MFSLPLLSAQEQQEGCPTVDLPDNADDFNSLLRLLY